MARAHIGLEQQLAVAGLHLAQLGHPLGGFPIGHARVVEAGSHQHRRIVLRRYLVIGAVAEDIGEGLLAQDRVPPFGPFARRQRQFSVEHGRQHIDEGHMRHHRAPQLGIGVDHRAHQLAARRTARNADPAFLGIALGDQPLRHVDEIVEGIGAFVELALQIPLAPQIVAAANMRDGVGIAAIDQAQPRSREARRDRVAIGAVGIEVQRPSLRPILAHDDAERNHRTVARGDLDTLGGVERGVVTAGDFLLLEQFEFARGDVVVIDRIGRDHALVGQPQDVLIVFGIVAQPCAEAGFGKGDRLDQIGILVGPQLDLVEPAQSPFGDIEVLEQFETGQVKLVRSGDQRGPVARRLELGSRQPEIDVVVIGMDPHRAVAHIDIVFDALLPRLDQHLLRRGIVRRNQADFAGLVVAGRNDQPVFLRRQAGADAKTLIHGFAVEFDVFADRRSEDMHGRIVDAPIVVRSAIDQRRVVLHPDEVRQRAGNLVGEQFARFQVLDPRGKAF